MVLAGSNSAGSLTWSARARTDPSGDRTTATRSKRARMERASTDFLTYSISRVATDGQQRTRRRRLRVARTVYAAAVGTRSERGVGHVLNVPDSIGHVENVPHVPAY